jgi:hypothetical protein
VPQDHAAQSPGRRAWSHNNLQKSFFGLNQLKIKQFKECPDRGPPPRSPGFSSRRATFRWDGRLREELRSIVTLPRKCCSRCNTDAVLRHRKATGDKRHGSLTIRITGSQPAPTRRSSSVSTPMGHPFLSAGGPPGQRGRQPNIDRRLRHARSVSIAMWKQIGISRLYHRYRMQTLHRFCYLQVAPRPRIRSGSMERPVWRNLSSWYGV